MKRLILMVVAIVAFVVTADAQGFLKKLKDKAIERVQDKIETKVERETDDAMDGVLDGKTSKSEKSSKKSKKNNDDTSEDTSVDTSEDTSAPQIATSTDFKRGSVILFEDDVTRERVGEFPSKWDLLDGAAEVKTIGGVKAIEPTNNAMITPLLKQQGAYLPEEFTLEYDFYYWKSKEDIGLNDVKLILLNSTDRSRNYFSDDENSFTLVHGVCDCAEHNYNFKGRSTGFSYKFKQGWNHVAISFNKRALKAYFNGNRVANLPNVQQPAWFAFQVPFEYVGLTFIRNVVLAKGAVELYDRDASDIDKAIEQTGKFVTNNILFKTGKADLLPESMTEIEKVATYMKKNPRARFEVQGHTDNQGSDKINDPLSQQRAEAVVKALASLGVDDFNLKAVGKGSHEPVADNKTEAGRANNRRVEFIKK